MTAGTTSMPNGLVARPSPRTTEPRTGGRHSGRDVGHCELDQSVGDVRGRGPDAVELDLIGRRETRSRQCHRSPHAHTRRGGGRNVGKVKLLLPLLSRYGRRRHRPVVTADRTDRTRCTRTPYGTGSSVVNDAAAPRRTVLRSSTRRSAGARISPAPRSPPGPPSPGASSMTALWRKVRISLSGANS